MEYESVLDLQDEHGRFSQFKKREKVRYLQNHIIAYQDQAWGDGKILLDYQCVPGVVVDQYRPGQKTFILISLRQEKRRGDIDEFHIAWKMKDAFIREYELWESDIRHKTRMIKMQVLFPKERRPHRFWVEEALSKQHIKLDASHLLKLPNGRFQLTYEVQKPQLNARYQLHWEW